MNNEQRKQSHLIILFNTVSALVKPIKVVVKEIKNFIPSFSMLLQNHQP